MNVTTISQLRKNTKKYFDEMIDNQDILVITRSDGRSVVAMPLAHYNSMSETEYLLSSPKNALRLKRGIEEARMGKTNKKTLSELRQYE